MRCTLWVSVMAQIISSLIIMQRLRCPPPTAKTRERPCEVSPGWATSLCVKRWPRSERGRSTPEEGDKAADSAYCTSVTAHVVAQLAFRRDRRLATTRVATATVPRLSPCASTSTASTSVVITNHADNHIMPSQRHKIVHPLALARPPACPHMLPPPLPVSVLSLASFCA